MSQRRIRMGESSATESVSLQPCDDAWRHTLDAEFSAVAQTTKSKSRECRGRTDICNDLGRKERMMLKTCLFQAERLRAANTNARDELAELGFGVCCLELRLNKRVLGLGSRV